MFNTAMPAIALLTVLSTAGAVTKPGACPTVTALDGFDLQRYVGRWFEIAKFPVSFEDNLDCVTAEYSPSSNGHILVNNTGRVVGSNPSRFSSAIGDGMLNGDPKIGDLRVRFSSAAPYAPYIVLDTDFENYSLVFSCTNFGAFNIQDLWILSRANSLPAKSIDFLINKARSLGTDVYKLVATQQQFCT